MSERIHPAQRWRPAVRATGASPLGPACALADSASGDRGQPINRTVVFAIIAMALLMLAVDETIVATALHALQQRLGTSLDWAGWTLTAYSLGFVLMLPVSGKLCDGYGRRRVFLASVATFTFASLCCGLVDNIYALVALRALQAAGGAGCTPAATAMVVDCFGDQRDRAVSLFGSVFSVGAMLGPLVGGVFVAYWTWRGVFFVNVPIGAAVVVLGLRHIPRDRPRAADAHFRMDGTGMGLLGVGLLAGMLAASALAGAGGRAWSAEFAVPAAIAVAALTLFFRHIGRVVQPFLPPRLIHGHGFGEVNLVNGVYCGISSGAVTLVPLYAISRYGMGALDSSTLLLAQAAAAIALSVAATLALRRTGQRLPLYAGGVVIAAGLLLFALCPRLGLSSYAWLAGAACLVGAGGGIMNPASRNAGLHLAPEQSATLASLRLMSRQVGAIVAISIATAAVTGAQDPAAAQACVGAGGPAQAQAWFYVAAALLLLVALPLIARVPEHRGAW